MDNKMSSKRELVIVVAKQHPNPRAHNLLFKNNTPFKPKVVQNKLGFKRHKKHKNSVDQ